MATNEILQFAETDTGTNLLTQAEYLADSQRPIGNQPGVARSKLVNKALRQSSLIAAGLAEYIADNQANNITDALTPQNIADYLQAAIAGALGVTQPQFDNDTSLATTAFVQRALGNFRSDSAQISVDTTLTAADAGSPYIVTGAASNITLPTLAAAPPGTAFTFVTDKVVSFKGNGAEQIHNGAGQSNSYAVFPGEALTIVAAGSVWSVVSHGYGAGSYAANTATNGYQKLPSGLIIQWGLATSGAGGNVTVTFPIAFPTSILRGYASCPVGNIIGGVGSATNSTLQIGATIANTAGAAVGYAIPWFAIGY